MLGQCHCHCKSNNKWDQNSDHIIQHSAGLDAYESDDSCCSRGDILNICQCHISTSYSRTEHCCIEWIFHLQVDSEHCWFCNTKQCWDTGRNCDALHLLILCTEHCCQCCSTLSHIVACCDCKEERSACCNQLDINRENLSLLIQFWMRNSLD